MTIGDSFQQAMDAVLALLPTLFGSLVLLGIALVVAKLAASRVRD